MTAIKTQVGPQTQAQDAPYSPSGSVQESNLFDAIQRIKNLVDSRTGDVSGPNGSTAGNIPVFDDATGKVIEDSGVSLTLLQSGIAQGLADLADDIANVADDLSDHISDATAAHAASAIANTPAGNISATTVQSALNELDNEKATTGSVTTVANNLSTHTGASAGAHAGSAISNTPAGGISATNVQSAINELDAEKAALADVRTRLTGPSTLNVGAGQTYATLSAAIAALGTIDQRGFRATIQIADGTSYAGGVYNVNLTGPLTINGNSSTPANVIFTSAITFTGYGDVTFQNMRLATTTGANLTLDGPGVTLRFGAGMEFYGTPSTGHILIHNGATFANTAGGFTLGSGAFRWLWATNGARIAFSNFTLTTANTPAWSGEGIYLGGGAVMTMFAVTMAGTGATGKRYTVEYPGMLNSFGAGTPSTYYPGSTDGTHTVALGFSTTSVSLGTISSGTVTPNPHVGGVQHYTNNGAHTLAPPVSTYHGSMVVDITNGASAGAITTSGFTKVAGDSFTTTNGHKFRCVISVGNASSLLQVQAMQ